MSSSVASSVVAERKLLAERLSRLSSSPCSSSSSSSDFSADVKEFEVGDAVEAGPTWSRGKIIGRGSLYTVAYADGLVERLDKAEIRCESGSVRAEILDLYSRFNPEKISSVDAMLTRCGRGNEAALLEAVRKKYNIKEVIPEEDDTREQVIFEALVCSEENFCEALRRLSALKKHGPLLTLFASAEPICGLACSLRDELRREGAKKPVCVGKIFAKYGPFLKMFATYAQRFAETRHERLALLSEEPSFDKRRQLEEDLASPLHRVLKYERALQELCDSTPLVHPDRPDLVLAIQAAAQAQDHVRSTLRNDAAFRRLLHKVRPLLNSSSSPAPLPLDECEPPSVVSKLLIVEGPLEEITSARKSIFSTTQPREAFLLGDRLVLAKRSGLRRRLVRIRDLPLATIDSARRFDKSSFEVLARGGEVILSLRAATGDVANLWVEELNKLLRGRAAEQEEEEDPEVFDERIQRSYKKQTPIKKKTPPPSSKSKPWYNPGAGMLSFSVSPSTLPE